MSPRGHEPGEPSEERKTLEVKLGSDVCGGLNDEQKNLQMRDLAAANHWKVPAGQPAPRPVSKDDWESIIKAIKKKYPGWEYTGSGPASCCCCVP